MKGWVWELGVEEGWRKGRGGREGVREVEWEGGRQAGRKGAVILIFLNKKPNEKDG